MSNKIFTQDEIEILSSNKYVKHVSAKGITYTDEFKRIFIAENEKGKIPTVIFKECGFDIDILGLDRVKSSGKRWRAAYREDGILGLQDTRVENSGRPREKNLTLEEKYDIVCPIRKANPYRRMMKATQEHRVLPNLLNRQFKQNIPGQVLLTDITYLFYGNGRKAYLSTVKDGSTNEILAYHLSDKLTLDIATDTIHKLVNNRHVQLAQDAFIHSDQGVHYTSPVFQALVKSYNLNQSMSRRGNCWDNAPQESFFGHFKDEACIKPFQSLRELEQEIDEYMAYYNNYRYQWGLNKMTPAQYRDHFLKTA